MGCRSSPAPIDLDPDAVVIMITGHGTVESAVAAMRAGAFDFLLKPLPSNDVLRLAVERATERRRLIEENRRLREPLAPRMGFDHVVGKSPAMLAIFDLVRKAARSDANILIEGESGTGKELIARAIHAQSPRAAEVFVPVDCAALPDTLLESELFGHERGAFTGADRVQAGDDRGRGPRHAVPRRDRGAAPDAAGQAPPGASGTADPTRRGDPVLNVDIRLVSATNRDTAELVRKGEFREDLFFRVNVITITLPPLRERAGDVGLLAHHFLGRYGRNRDRPLDGIDPEALARLDAHAWPGNVRELQNVIERACALADGPTIRVRDLPDHVRGRGRPAPTAPGKDLPLAEAREAWFQAFAQEYLSDLLRRHGGNISQAAKTAGVDRKTLHRLLTKHGIRA